MQPTPVIIGVTVIGVILALCFGIVVLALCLQKRRVDQKSRVMVTMSGTTIMHRGGGRSVLEATWIPSLVGPGNASFENDRRRKVVSGGSSDNSLDLEKGKGSPIRYTEKRSSYNSAKRLEIPEVLAEEGPEEGLEEDKAQSEKGSNDSPSLQSEVVTPTEARPPTIYIQDVDASPLQSPRFEKSFEMEFPSNPLGEKAAVHAV